VIYSVLADMVVAIHLAYVSYVVFGQLLIVIGIPLGWRWVRNFWFRISHLAMIVVVAMEALAKFECPLTTWEYQLLAASGTEAEHRSLVGRLMHNLMFFDCSDQSWVWPWIYCTAAGLVFSTFVLAPPTCPEFFSRPLRLARARLLARHVR
jgi:Protein of Unknown function (DUF2784)